jgi:sigma-B regulation protein RsbU (phosphoserine phosphatase)
MNTTTHNVIGGTPKGITVLLVDDQEIVAAAVRNMLIDQPDIDFHYCSDPSRVIDLATEIQPTVILQDLVMPEVNGLTLVRFFRANPATSNVPIVVLSSKEEASTKAEAFACGANDYLVKFPDKLEVLARLRYHSQGYIALQERNRAYAVLTKELAEAADYVTSLLPERLTGKPATEWCFVPSTQLGGDSFGYHWIDDAHFGIYLLDVCGHGVGAALLSVSAMNVLRSQSLPDVDFTQPAEVLTGLNEAFQMENHNDMFFTIWYGVFNRTSNRLHYASAGHPPALLIDGTSAEDATLTELGTHGIVIGAMDDSQFQSASVEVGPFNRLYVYSDGAYEVTDKTTGKLWELEAWIELVRGHSLDAANPKLDQLRQQVALLQGSEQFEDDFSLLEIRF